jgi:hypothetical protein
MPPFGNLLRSLDTYVTRSLADDEEIAFNTRYDTRSCSGCRTGTLSVSCTRRRSTQEQQTRVAMPLSTDGIGGA